MMLQFNRNMVLSALAVAAMGFVPAGSKLQLQLLSGSGVLVHGETNLSSFCCQGGMPKAMESARADLLSEEGKVVFSGARFSVPTAQMDCGNRLMNSDLQKTLKADQHPTIQFELKSLEFSKRRGQTGGIVNLSMVVAGEQRNVQSRFNFLMDDRALYLFGKIALRFSDFHLIPPKRLGGAIQVEENFEVEFNLLFAPQ